jgi:NAD(P)-dependent dehydrogenase (short-subunit alcohol dehydrogenase family)
VQTFSILADMTIREEVEALFDGAVAKFGRLDITVATVGGNPPPNPGGEGPVHHNSEDYDESAAAASSVLGLSWDQYLRTTATTQFSAWHTAQAAAQRMVAQGDGGRIVLIGSVMADIAASGASTYSSSKAAVRQLGRTMANELGQHGINVNVVQPGHILSNVELNAMTKEAIANRDHNIPVGRMGTPADIGGCVAFLCSRAAAYISGATIDVDGGWNVALMIPTEDPPPRL